MKLFKRISLAIFAFLAFLLIILGIFLAFLGPIGEYAIEKYDEEYTGRRIEMSDLQLNALTGGLEIHEFKLSFLCWVAPK